MSTVRILQIEAKELVGVEEFDFENISKARAKGIDIIADKRYMNIDVNQLALDF